MKWLFLFILLLCSCTSKEIISSSEAFIYFIDVGQGDATLIQQDEYSILIDCGPKDSNLISFLNQTLTDSKIDLLIVTHSDSDHFGGCEKVTQGFEVEKTWENPESKGKVKVRKSDVILLKDIEIEILSPEFLFEKENDNSLVTLITFANLKILIMGDCEKECENNIDQEADILRTGHHGSDTSTSEEFLQRVNPQLAIISVGENDYGHPSQDVLTNLKNIKTLRTDQLGTISFKIEKNGVLTLIT